MRTIVAILFVAFCCVAAPPPPLPPSRVPFVQPLGTVLTQLVVLSPAKPLLSPKDEASRSGASMVAKPKKVIALRLWYQDAKGWHVTDAGLGIPEDKLTMRHWKLEAKPDSVRMTNTKTGDWLESNFIGADRFKWKLQAK